VFNTLGQLVKALEFQDLLSQGEVVLHWDGRDEAGRLLPSGVYFAIVDTPHGQVRVKVAFLGQ
jgi:flagellar hook assembly protein FlgD